MEPPLNADCRRHQAIVQIRKGNRSRRRMAALGRPCFEPTFARTARRPRAAILRLDFNDDPFSLPGRCDFVSHLDQLGEQLVGGGDLQTIRAEPGFVAAELMLSRRRQVAEVTVSQLDHERMRQR